MATLTIPTNTNIAWSGLEDTSSTSTTAALAAKTLTVSAGKAWPAGCPLAMTAVGTKLYTSLCCAAITSYSGTTLTLTPTGYTSIGALTSQTPGTVCTMAGEFAKQAYSSTSLTVGTGTKTLQTRPNLSLVATDAIRIVFRTTPATFMDGTVTSYDAATGMLTVSIATTGGSGTQADWQIVSSGTISSWLIHPNHQDVIDVLSGATLTIDKTNLGLPTRVQALTTGTILFTNSSGSVPVIFRLGQRVVNTGLGRIITAQNGTVRARGGFINLTTGNGGALNYTFGSDWDAMTAPTYVEVETAASSGTFERWMVSGSQFYGFNRYGYVYGTEFGKVPTNLYISNFGGGTGVGTLGTIVGGSGYGGIVSTLGTLTGGTLYTTGVYQDIPLTVSSGTAGNGARADITVVGGAVVKVNMRAYGCGYSATSVLTAAAANIGGTGSGFTVAVSAVVAAGVFSDVPLTGGTGSGATAHITIAAGVVTAVEIVNAGTGYTSADSLSASTTYLGAGSAFAVPITIIGQPTGTFRVTGGSGANGLVTISTIAATGIGRLGSITAGSGYVPGTYTNVPLKNTSGNGGGGRVTITVGAGGTVTAQTLVDGGTSYAAANALTVDNTFLGGSGSGYATTVSTLANVVAGAYFSGFDGAPSAFAAGDILTIASATAGGSIQPTFYVADVGDYSCTTPLTNILNSVTQTAPTTNSPYAPYKIYSCTGGSGSGAKFVYLNATNGGAPIGGQAGYFVAGTGYAINDVITVGEYGFQVKVTEIQNSLTQHVFQKVCIFDPASRTLRFGADPDARPVPNGAIVRVPNIVIDSVPLEAPTIAGIVSCESLVLQFESAAITGDWVAGAAHMDYEGITMGTKSGANYPITRGQRGTRKNVHAAGTIVTLLPGGRQTGTQRAQFISLNTQTGGAIDLDTMMFGLWFMPTSGYTRSLIMNNVGWSGAMISTTTTGPVSITDFNQANYPFSPATDSSGSFTAIQNNLTLTNGNIAQCNYNDTNNTITLVAFSNCPAIAGLNNLNIGFIRGWKNDARALNLTNSFFTNDSTAIPHDINMVGGQLYLSTMASIRFYNLSFASNLNRNIVANYAASAHTYTTPGGYTVITMTNSAGIIVHNVSFFAQPPKTDILSIDAGCANILLHTVTGNGAWGGFALTNRFLTSLGLNCKLANVSIANLRTPYSTVANNTQTGTILQNTRTSTSLVNQSPTVFVGVGARSGASSGVGHSSADIIDYMTAYAPYWATAGSMTPNLPDATWFMNLVDSGLSPTTGRVTVGCGGPSSSQLTFTGSADTYTDNGGRLFIGQANDIVEIQNIFPMRGITGFQSVNPVSEFDRTGAALQSFYSYTITNGGTGYTTVTVTPVTGGTGYGGIFSLSQASGIVNGGFMVAGIGYSVGDVLTITGGSGTAQITLTSVKKFYVRMCPWGSDITAQSYMPLTYANLQSQFAAIVGYTSNTGLKMQIKIQADANVQDLSSYIDFIALFTTVDSTFNPPIGYTDYTITGLASATSVGIFDGATEIDYDASLTGTHIEELPINFDGNYKTLYMKIRNLEYTWDDHSVNYYTTAFTRASLQTLDSQVSDTRTNVMAYSAIDTPAKIYDYSKYWGSLESNLLVSQLCSKTGSAINFGSYNLLVNKTATSVLSLSGGTVILKADKINTGSITTTGTYNLANGATHGSTSISSNNYTTPLTQTISLPALLNGTRLRIVNVTNSNTELVNTVVSGTGYSITLTEGLNYAAGDVIRGVATYANGTTYKLPFAFSVTASSGTAVFGDAQTDWIFPNSLALDWTTIIECSTDYVTVEVDVNDPDNIGYKSRYAIFITGALTEADGIRNWVTLTGIPVISWLSAATVIIDATIATVTVVNIKPSTKLSVKDIFAFHWSDNIDRADAILGSSIIWQNPLEVAIAETGTSGLTTSEAATLAKIDTLTENSSGLRFTAKALETAPSSSGSGASLAEIEGSTILAKEATSASIRKNTDLIPAAL